MEEPRTQDARPQDNRDVPRSRIPRSAFSTPEPATPEGGPKPKDKPTEPAPRRQGAAKAAPAVTFQPPRDKESNSSPGTGSEASVPGKPARVTPSRKGSAKANRAKADAVKPSTGDTARPQTPAAQPAATRKPGDARTAADTRPVEAKPTTPTPVEAKPTTPTPVEAKPTTPTPVEAKPTTPTPVEAKPTTPTPAGGRQTGAKRVDAGPTPSEGVGSEQTAAGDSGPLGSDAATAEAAASTTAKSRRKAAGRRTTTGRGAVPAEEVTTAVVKAAPAKRAPRRATTAAGPAQPSTTEPPTTEPQTTEPQTAEPQTTGPHTARPDPASTELAPVPATSAPAAAAEAPARAVNAPDVVVAAAPEGGQKAAPEGGQQAAPMAVAATTVATAAASVARYDWSKVVSDPGHTPELMALAAVETIGPRAAEWVRRTRESYPTATPQGLARLAIAEFTRRGTVGAALGAVAGSYAPMALMGAAVWTQAELVLHVAAAHGHDPADQARAAELLVLAKVHPTRADAEAALAAARQPGAGSVDTRLRVGRPLATQLGGWLAIRTVNRFFPGTSVVLATLFSRGAAEMLGVRAIGLYEGKQSR
jgi:hypothetical protein